MNEKKKCGLVGERLGHSYSPQIHRELGDYSYSLFEVASEELGAFMRAGDFDAINVTVPYKTAVIPYISELSDTARKIGSVNTVVKCSDGTYFGDNTDCFGFVYMLSRAGMDVKGKKVLILGSGGSSLTVRYALETLGVGECVVISRSGDDNYENISRHFDAEIIVNTTPVGMYPNNGKSPLSLDGFERLEGVADLIFNPRMTELCFDACDRGIKYTSGLSMLVAQAKAASERFCGSSVDDLVIERIIEKTERDTENIILIGMPGCGKSTVGRVLAAELGREFVDTDAEIVRRLGKSIPEIFSEEGEEAFRRYEHEVICDICKKSSLVISLGGGAPTKENNIRPIRQNGKVVFLRRDIKELSRDGRPLSQGADLYEMYEKRLPHYLAAADISVELCDTPAHSAKSIKEKLYPNRKIARKDEA